jgi:hypothetical protein
MALELLLTRRQFLRLGRDVLLILCALPGLSSAKSALSRRTAVLDARQCETILVMARTLFQHDTAPEELYRNAVLALDRQCALSAETRSVVFDGVARLGASFTRLSAAVRVDVLKALEATDFFRVVYSAVLGQVYGDPESWSIVSSELVPA